MRFGTFRSKSIKEMITSAELIREFEMQRMKESQTIKEYSGKLLSLVNSVRYLSTEFSDVRIVQKLST